MGRKKRKNKQTVLVYHIAKQAEDYLGDGSIKYLSKNPGEGFKVTLLLLQFPPKDLVIHIQLSRGERNSKSTFW